MTFDTSASTPCRTPDIPLVETNATAAGMFRHGYIKAVTQTHWVDDAYRRALVYVEEDPVRQRGIPMSFRFDLLLVHDEATWTPSVKVSARRKGCRRFLPIRQKPLEGLASMYGPLATDADTQLVEFADCARKLDQQTA